MLVSWMRENNTTYWATSIRFVQFQKNSRDHVGIKRSPCEVMFGCAPKVDLSTTIPNEIFQVLQKEEDLQAQALWSISVSRDDNSPDMEKGMY